MAKAKSEPAAVEAAPSTLTGQIVVRHHSSHEKSPDQAEVLVAGLRVAYISYAAPHPISFFPHAYLGKTLAPDELETIIRVAREEVAKLAADQQSAQDRIAKLVAGELE